MYATFTKKQSIRTDHNADRHAWVSLSQRRSRMKLTPKRRAAQNHFLITERRAHALLFRELHPTRPRAEVRRGGEQGLAAVYVEEHHQGGALVAELGAALVPSLEGVSAQRPSVDDPHGVGLRGEGVGDDLHGALQPLGERSRGGLCVELARHPLKDKRQARPDPHHDEVEAVH